MKLRNGDVVRNTHSGSAYVVTDINLATGIITLHSAACGHLKTFPDVGCFQVLSTTGVWHAIEPLVHPRAAEIEKLARSLETLFEAAYGEGTFRSDGVRLRSPYWGDWKRFVKEATTLLGANEKTPEPSPTVPTVENLARALAREFWRGAFRMARGMARGSERLHVYGHRNSRTFAEANWEKFVLKAETALQ